MRTRVSWFDLFVMRVLWFYVFGGVFLLSSRPHVFYVDFRKRVVVRFSAAWNLMSAMEFKFVGFCPPTF
jgi:hypothetical protein